MIDTTPRELITAVKQDIESAGIGPNNIEDPRALVWRYCVIAEAEPFDSPEKKRAEREAMTAIERVGGEIADHGDPGDNWTWFYSAAKWWRIQTTTF